jgi:hypothetical protein
MTDTSGQEISKNTKLFNSSVSQLHLTDITKQYIQQQQSIHAFQALWNDIKTACLLSRATTYQKPSSLVSEQQKCVSFSSGVWEVQGKDGDIFLSFIILTFTYMGIHFWGHLPLPHC